MVSALRDGVKYANGGRSLKHLGVPCITMPMGNLADEKMPVGLSFCGKAYEDSKLLSYAFAYETESKRRVTPPLAPLLPSDEIPITTFRPTSPTMMSPTLNITSTSVMSEDTPDLDVRIVEVKGICFLSSSTKARISLEIYANGEPTHPVSWVGSNWEWTARLTRPKSNDKYPALAKVPRDQFLIVLISKSDNGRSSGSFILVD
jgi:hypothetical protein